MAKVVGYPERLRQATTPVRIMTRALVALPWLRPREVQVFACRRVRSGTWWSQHAWGNAVDAFYADPDRRERAARFLVRWHRALRVHRVISGTREWDRREGWEPYDGPAHETHLHAEGEPFRTGTPPCAR